MNKTLLTLSAVVTLAVSSIGPALAYPAGQAPVLGFSTIGRIVPGDPVSVNVTRVKKSCTVTVSWSDSDDAISPVSKVVKANGATGVISIATPTTAGTYTLTTGISAACAGTASPVTLSKSVVVGKLSSIVAKLTTTSGYVSRNPTIAATGTITSGSVAVANKSITLTLKKDGVTVKTMTGTTNSSGAYNIAFSGNSYAIGYYTAEVRIKKGSLYGESAVTTAAIRLR